jgi:hypothetical protein
MKMNMPLMTLVPSLAQMNCTFLSSKLHVNSAVRSVTANIVHLTCLQAPRLQILKFVIPLLSFNTIQILADQLFDN